MLDDITFEYYSFTGSIACTEPTNLSMLYFNLNMKLPEPEYNTTNWAGLISHETIHQVLFMIGEDMANAHFDGMYYTTESFRRDGHALHYKATGFPNSIYKRLV